MYIINEIFVKGRVIVDNNAIELKVTSVEIIARNDLDAVIYDLNKKIEFLSSQADKWDYLVALLLVNEEYEQVQWFFCFGGKCI